MLREFIIAFRYIQTRSLDQALGANRHKMHSRSNRSARFKHLTTKKRCFLLVFCGPRNMEKEMQMGESEINDILYAGFDIRFI